MSIIQTKIFKESVETPVLKTNDIEYMGFSIPMYDVVESDFVPNDIEQSVQLNKNTSSNKECNCIRILPNTNLFEKIGMMSITGISLFSHAKQGNQNFVVLCVYAKKNGQYKFIGHSTNAFPNSNNALEMIFQFDNLKLFDSIQKDGDVVYTPYREVFIKPLMVESTQNGEIISTIENPDWNNALFTTLRLRGCSNSHINFSPYVTDYDLTFGPHVRMKFKAGNYVVGDKIPHNSNGFVHLTPLEKEKVNDLYDLSISYFNDSDTEQTFIPIDTRLLDQQYHRTNGQVMCAFTIDPTDYVGKIISELRFRHAVNTDTRMVNKYLQADCYNESGVLIDTFFSIEPKTQTATATGETTFQFYNNFIIKENYKNIQFRISPSNVERANTTYYSFAGSSLRNSQTNENNSKYRAKDGWILKWLNGAPVSGTNPIAQNNLTPDFTIIFGSREIIKGSGFIKHINNNDIHFNNSQKDDLLNLISKSDDLYSPHVENDEIHVTAEDKERWDNSTVELNAGSFIEIGENNTISVKTADSLAYDDSTVPTTKAMYLEMGYVLTDAQIYADDAVTGHRNQSGLHTSTLLQNKWNGHVDDDTIHVTQTEKSQIAKVTNIQSNIEDLETKYNDVITILNNSLPDIETFSTLDSGNYKINSGGKSNATGVQLSREHFTTGSIKVVEICHTDGINANDIRLCAIVFNHGENENTPKSLDDCIFSVNTQTQTSGVGGSMCFRFNNLELPDDYEFVKFLFAKGDTVIPVHNNAETVIEARIQVLARNVDNGGFEESPDDECKVMHISSTSNWYPHVRVMKTVLGYSDIVSLINRVSQLEARVSVLENS